MRRGRNAGVSLCLALALVTLASGCAGEVSGAVAAKSSSNTSHYTGEIGMKTLKDLTAYLTCTDVRVTNTSAQIAARASCTYRRQTIQVFEFANESEFHMFEAANGPNNSTKYAAYGWRLVAWPENGAQLKSLVEALGSPYSHQ